MAKNDASDDPRRARLAAALRANLKRRKAGGGPLPQPAERDGGAQEDGDQGEHDA